MRIFGSGKRAAGAGLAVGVARLVLAAFAAAVLALPAGAATVER